MKSNFLSLVVVTAAILLTEFPSSSGLMANGFLASENTGTTNELLLARWYINEISLDIDDIKNASSKEDASAAYKAATKAVNSYLALLNRVMTSKVGDKFVLL